MSYAQVCHIHVLCIYLYIPIYIWKKILQYHPIQKFLWQSPYYKSNVQVPVFRGSGQIHWVSPGFLFKSKSWLNSQVKCANTSCHTVMIGGRMIVVHAIQCKFIDFMNLTNLLWFDDTQLLYWGLISSESVCSNFTQANKATRHLKEAIPLDRWTMLRPWFSKFWLAETPWIQGKSYQPSLEITG